MYSNLKDINKRRNFSNLEMVLIVFVVIIMKIIRKINSNSFVNKLKMVKN